VRSLDFSSWQGLLSTLLGLSIITLIGVGIRLLVMQTVQQRRARENRQINERLKTLIAAYKTLGGSFTGNLLVDPRHLRDTRRDVETPAQVAADATLAAGPPTVHAAVEDEYPGTDRSRRIRDAVEAALSDIILLGTHEQLVLAANAASELAAGRPVHTAELVVSLRNFIRQVLDLEPVPTTLSIPRQGPARVTASKGKEGGGKDGARQGDGEGAAGGGMGYGFGLGTDKAPDLSVRAGSKE
jgi:heme exporter protein D